MSKRILIVEDEPLIAMMLEDFLDEAGMTAVGTADTVASAIASADEGGIDAAILDVNLSGGETSFPVAQKLADANIPFVFATGGSGDTIPPEWRDRPQLSKPYTMEGVVAAIEGLA